MAKVFYLHWNEAELRERIAPFERAGHEVRAHSSRGDVAKWGEWRPDVVVISLDRLPSHGRAYAEWIWEAKSRRSIPIVFAGGAPDKVAATRKKFPAAIYCPTADALRTAERALPSSRGS
jgi:hypothetical protein